MNWNKAYIITIDKGGLLGGFNAKNFHDRLVNAKGVISWWHYIDNTYIIIVKYGVTAANVMDLVRSIEKNRKFFICELNLNNHNGILPQDAWDWINKQNTQIRY